MKKIFETERLLVRELQEEDWLKVFEMNTSIEVMRQIGEGKIKTAEEEQSSFKSILANYQKGTGLGVWAVVRKGDNTFIGAASMAPLADTNEIQLGYRLKKQYWKQGYGTEIAKGLVDYGFNYLNLDKVTATTNLDNDASRRVLQKAGLSFEKKDVYNNWPMNYFVIHKKKE
ncbi:GNAT family N-acetyltransferase [Rhodocytophaga aerolata]|uniref:GNAT family N-acetyltransferase n=1 Tax=Rhodocytophaga aerolata TaxID=455078 RepID=A0ABT8R6Z3_9BACT|nr:GNAT family N-acetyltransferase [Rhodocytophaga aerolata]MDO1447871.1 GNAT family N-acetyltransferase [Rhodocytophaga aerolata]